MKTFTVTSTDDLFAHLEALKLYYGYSTRAELIEKALDRMINECATDEAFQYYLAETREILNERETKE